MVAEDIEGQVLAGSARDISGQGSQKKASNRSSGKEKHVLLGSLCVKLQIVGGHSSLKAGNSATASI